MRLTTDGLLALPSEMARVRLFASTAEAQHRLGGRVSLVRHLLAGSTSDEQVHLLDLSDIKQKFHDHLVSAINAYNDAKYLPSADNIAEILLGYSEGDKRDVFNAYHTFFNWSKENTKIIAKAIGQNANQAEIASIKALFTTARDQTDSEHPVVAALTKSQTVVGRWTKLRQRFFKARAEQVPLHGSYAQLPKDPAHDDFAPVGGKHQPL